MTVIDPIFLSRVQFAFTVSFHIIFPSLSIGLASFLAVLEGLWLKTNDKRYQDIYFFWIKIFAVCFGMGVVSGVVMSYEFGTNWSVFSDKVGNVLGPLLGYEVLTAFFLEASFLGVMLFGWGRVSAKMHFSATVIVAIGTLISAFWILAANSWMQTPQGFAITADESARFYPLNWLQIIFNPSFPYRFPHMVIAAYLSTAFLVGGIASYYLINKQHIKHAKIILSMATLMAIIVAPLQLFIGDLHGINTLAHQPAKVAAIEGVWETSKHVPLLLFAIPDEKAHKNLAEVKIPGLASLILTHDWHGTVRGLNEFKENIPPVGIVFYAFRLMVGIGMLMILIGVLSVIQYLRKQLFTSSWLHICWIIMAPAGLIAVIAGWFVTEIGRQPYSVYGVLRTLDAATPALLGPQVAWSLASFIVIYAFIFGAAIYYILKLIGKGIVSTTVNKEYYKESKYASVIETVSLGKGDGNV